MIQAAAVTELWPSLVVQIVGSTVGGLISLAIAILVLRRTKKDSLAIASHLAAKQAANDLYLAFVGLASHFVSLREPAVLLTPEGRDQTNREFDELRLVILRVGPALDALDDVDASRFLAEASLSATDFLYSWQRIAAQGDNPLRKTADLECLISRFGDWLMGVSMYSRYLVRQKTVSAFPVPARFVPPESTPSDLSD